MGQLITKVEIFNRRRRKQAFSFVTALFTQYLVLKYITYVIRLNLSVFKVKIKIEGKTLIGSYFWE